VECHREVHTEGIQSVKTTESVAHPLPAPVRPTPSDFQELLRICAAAGTP